MAAFFPLSDLKKNIRQAKGIVVIGLSNQVLEYWYSIEVLELNLKQCYYHGMNSLFGNSFNVTYSSASQNQRNHNRVFRLDT